MEKLEQWRLELWDHKYLIVISCIFLGTSLLLNYIAGTYTNLVGTVATADLILDHLPSINLSLLFIYGPVIIIAVLVLYPILYRIKEFHIVISQFSLLLLLRSFFISLTHLKVPASAVALELPSVYNVLVFQNDLFFSAHTAIPFLGVLLFRNERIKYFFLIATVVEAATVLFMHVHYSIDVFAALFITYGSYKIGNWFFKSVEDKKETTVTSAKTEL